MFLVCLCFPGPPTFLAFCPFLFVTLALRPPHPLLPDSIGVGFSAAAAAAAAAVLLLFCCLLFSLWSPFCSPPPFHPFSFLVRLEWCGMVFISLPPCCRCLCLVHCTDNSAGSLRSVGVRWGVRCLHERRGCHHRLRKHEDTRGRAEVKRSGALGVLRCDS